METSTAERFESDVRRVMENQYGFLAGENITTYYDECEAPILDVIEDGDTVKFVFRLTSNTYTFKKGKEHGEHEERRQVRVNRLNG